MLANKILSATGSNEEKLFVDDCFATHLYTGNGSTQTINNGIDLAGEGGLVWTKTRSIVNNHALVDSVRGFGSSAPILSSDLTAASSSIGSVPLSAESSGYTIGNSSGYVNGTGSTYVGWTFRRAPKFFDVVTYTGNGASNRQIAHSLGVAPGMIIVKRTDSSGGWITWHRSEPSKEGYLHMTIAFAANSEWGSNPTSSSFYVGGSNFQNFNINGATDVAYLFAHDPSAD